MKKIVFHYYGPTNIGRFLICARMASVVSHVAIQFEETNYQATMLKGVFKEPSSEMEKGFLAVELSVEDDKYEAAKILCESLVGLNYDFKAIVGFFFSFKLQGEDNWFCSELGRVVFEEATGASIPMLNLMSPGQLRLTIEGYKQGHSIATV